MITIISKKRKKELEAIEKELANLRVQMLEAHRWLSGYDWFLQPMWKYFFEAKTYIEHAREEMNKAFLNYISDVEKLAVEKVKKVAPDEKVASKKTKKVNKKTKSKK